MKVDKDRFAGTDIKNCIQCSRRLHPQYEKDICPTCIELNLFSEVKEYIRNNDVNETQVAEHFNLPNSKVRSWIREGRIQYKDTVGNKTMSQVFCQICGKPLDFGTVCAECRHLRGLEVVAKQHQEEVGQMRFIDRGKK
ncbi:MAG: hypothetical protein J1E62_04975 [Lachnospiraceae bacterium]|nr:hypothetical protein [Lachnospiraceae bacterium]